MYSEIIERYIHTYYSNKSKRYCLNIAKYFLQESYNRSELYEKLLEIKIPVFVYIYQHENSLVLNCRLEDFQFYKVLDAQQIFQELSMFIAAMNNREYTQKELQISDQDLCAEKGFDQKYGFRHRPAM